MSEAPAHVCLVGTCPSSKMLAPYKDASVEIWACGPDNAGPGALPRITRWFEIHGDLGLPGGGDWEASYIEWCNASLASGQFALSVQDMRLFPKAERLPFELLLTMFGRLPFTSSLAWMMAHALALGVKKIGLYGMDMSAKAEYVQQRPGMQLLIGLAEARGAEVYAPMESDILAPPVIYGFEFSSPYGRKTEIRRREIAGRVARLDADMATMRSERDHLAGALDDIDYNQSIWSAERDTALPQVVGTQET